MLPRWDINVTTTLTSANTNIIDTLQKDYFRVYEGNRNDNNRSSSSTNIGNNIQEPAGNFIADPWYTSSHQGNVTTATAFVAADDNRLIVPEEGIAAYTWAKLSNRFNETLSSANSSHFTSSPLSTLYHTLTLDFGTTAATISNRNSSSTITTDSIDNNSVAANGTDDLPVVNSTATIHYPLLLSASQPSLTAGISAVRTVVSHNGDNNDIALIDSAETLLADENDYDAVAAFNDGDSHAKNDLINQPLVNKNSENIISQNESFHQILYNARNGGGGGGGGGGGIGAGGANTILRDDLNGGSSFMLLLEDFGEYFYNYNGSSTVSGTTTNSLNITNIDFHTNCTNLSNLTNLTTSSLCYDAPSEVTRNYWALILIVFPIFTLFGNILVILSVFRERSLQTVTNYFIVSLAIADLLVAVVVMPFAVYALVNVTWGLPYFACDFYIAMDVICSTSSIFNLVAISVDRYIAVTQPIKYAKHRNSRRVCLTIVMVWAISAAIGSPIVLGLNNTPDRDPSLCMFYNTDFIVYSSLSSFYIPCIIMVFLYWNIFKALRSRARKQRAARKPHLSELAGGSVIENVAQTRRLAETALDSSRQASRIMPDEPATNTGSGSNEEEDENAISPDIDDCHVIVNDKSTEFMLATVVEETGNVVAQITSQPQLIVADTNGNHDSGYAPSNVDDVLTGIAEESPPDSPVVSGTLQRPTISSRQDTGADESSKREPALSAAIKPLSLVRYGVQEAMTLARTDSTLSTTSKTSSRRDKKPTQGSRFTIYKVHKPSKKKREKSSAKKERKATKTLAIVLGVFLFCWLPFFSCNIMDAMCAKFDKNCSPGITAFIFTTWLGYINSFVNPVIYTIFNPEFRKAFKKIMHIG